MLCFQAIAHIMDAYPNNVPALLEAAGERHLYWRYEMRRKYTCGIYKLTAPDGRCYIGSSCHIEKRLTEHNCLLTRNKHYNGRLQRAWNEYKHFDHETVEVCDRTMLAEREQHWINELQSYLIDRGLNAARNAQNNPQTDDTRRNIGDGNRGKRRTVEVRLAISENMKGRKLSAESRLKLGESLKAYYKTHPVSYERCLAISARLKGRKESEDVCRQKSERKKGTHDTEETRRKKSEAGKGKHSRPMSEEQKIKLREANLGKKATEETRQKMRASSRHISRPHTEENRRAISEANKGQPWSDAERKAYALRGPVSEETLRKRSEGAKRAWAKRKGDIS